MQLSDLDKKKIQHSIKGAILTSLSSVEKGHYITKSPITALVSLMFFEDGEVSINLVGSMNEIPIYGGLEKAKISVREICINNEVEKAVNTIVAQIEAASIPESEKQ